MTDEQLDPDQRSCPRCGADPGDVCRQPNGNKSPRIHAARKADQSDRSSTVNNATADGRAKGGKRAAQERRRRKAELDAQRQAKRDAAEQAAIEREAEALARDAARFAVDREKLKRDVLDAAADTVANLRLVNRSLRHVVIDDAGKPITLKVERRDKNGDTMRDSNGAAVIDEEPDVRGWATTADVNRMAQASASILNALRLEEGKPTGILEQRAGVEGELGEAGTAELLAWAATNLPDPPTGGGK